MHYPTEKRHTRPVEGLSCWVLTDGKPGMENQCLGLAEALGCTPVVKRIAVRLPWRRLPPALWLRPLAALSPAGSAVAPPWPALLIASGRQTAAVTATIRRAANRAAGRPALFAVQIQTPRLDPRRFDLVVVPEHDRLRGDNVVPTRGALHRVTPARLAEAAARFEDALAHLPRPRVAVLVGGTDRRQAVGPEEARALGEQLAALARAHGAGLMVTPSRRTGPRNEAALRQALSDVPAAIWDGSGENPYFAYLAHADAILVTADSVSMVSEACATGKPVFVVGAVPPSGKLRAFHDGLAAAGMTRPFTGRLETWHYAPLDETARVAHLVRERLALLR